MERIVAAAAAVLAAALGTSACTATTKVAPQPATPFPSASPTPTETPIHAAVLAGYAGMWHDYQQDLSTANWQNPTSPKHATGEALLDLENTLALYGHNGWIGKGSPILHPVVKRLPTPGGQPSAEVVDCADLSHALKYVAATGALKDSTPGGRHLIDATLVLKDGIWKVSSLATGEVGSC